MHLKLPKELAPLIALKTAPKAIEMVDNSIRTKNFVVSTIFDAYDSGPTQFLLVRHSSDNVIVYSNHHVTIR